MVLRRIHAAVELTETLHIVSADALQTEPRLFYLISDNGRNLAVVYRLRKGFQSKRP